MKKSMKEMRKQAAHRRRRIIMNDDGNDCWHGCWRGKPGEYRWHGKTGEPKTPENFLSKRTSPLVGSQVDAIFYCTGVFNVYHHKSDETEFRNDREWDWAWELAQQGRDSLQVKIDFGHEHGMEVFWSMRMNDTHDSRRPETARSPVTISQWKKEHPEYLMGKKFERFPHGGHRWSAVNYALSEVQDKVFRILEDVCTRYDVDGVELDFFRHPVYFKPQMTGQPVTQEHCGMMTRLLHKVREMTEKEALRRNRPLLIAVRVPDSLGYAKAIGLDVIRWLEDDLIDIIVGGGYFHFEPWENLVAVGKQYDVPVYACLSLSRIVDPRDSEMNPRHARKASIQVWRGEAMSAWNAGVNGIYTFNQFNPKDPIFRELGNPETLKDLEKICQFNPGPTRHMNGWLKDGSSFIKRPED